MLYELEKYAANSKMMMNVEERLLREVLDTFGCCYFAHFASEKKDLTNIELIPKYTLECGCCLSISGLERFRKRYINQVLSNSGSPSLKCCICRKPTSGNFQEIKSNHLGNRILAVVKTRGMIPITQDAKQKEALEASLESLAGEINSTLNFLRKPKVEVTPTLAESQPKSSSSFFFNGVSSSASSFWDCKPTQNPQNDSKQSPFGISKLACPSDNQPILAGFIHQNTQMDKITTPITFFSPSKTPVNSLFDNSSRPQRTRETPAASQISFSNRPEILFPVSHAEAPAPKTDKPSSMFGSQRYVSSKFFDIKHADKPSASLNTSYDQNGVSRKALNSRFDGQIVSGQRIERTFTMKKADQPCELFSNQNAKKDNSGEQKLISASICFTDCLNTGMEASKQNNPNLFEQKKERDSILNYFSCEQQNRAQNLAANKNSMFNTELPDTQTQILNNFLIQPKAQPTNQSTFPITIASKPEFKTTSINNKFTSGAHGGLFSAQNPVSTTSEESQNLLQKYTKSIKHPTPEASIPPRPTPFTATASNTTIFTACHSHITPATATHGQPRSMAVSYRDDMPANDVMAQSTDGLSDTSSFKRVDEQIDAERRSKDSYDTENDSYDEERVDFGCGDYECKCEVDKSEGSSEIILTNAPLAQFGQPNAPLAQFIQASGHQSRPMLVSTMNDAPAHSINQIRAEVKPSTTSTNPFTSSISRHRSFFNNKR